MPDVERNDFIEILSERARARTQMENFAEGDPYPPLGKTIKSLQAKDKAFIVFLDEHDRVEWEYDENHYKPIPQQEEIERRVLMLQNYSETLIPPKRIGVFRQTLARAMAACMSSQPREAEKALGGALSQITAQVRIYYMVGALAGLAIVLLSIAVMWLMRETLMSPLGKSAYAIFLSSMIGGITAFIAASQRKLELKSLSEWHYYVEGMLRILLGVLSAGIVLILFEGNLIGGGISTDNSSLAVFMSIGAVAGFSERFLPQLLDRTGYDLIASVDRTRLDEPGTDTVTPDRRSTRARSAAGKKARALKERLGPAPDEAHDGGPEPG